MSRSGLTLALVVASAGYGTRLQSGLPKQYVPLLGIPMLQRTLHTLSTCQVVDVLAVVVNSEDIDYCHVEIEHEHIEKVVKISGGGAERVLSVRNGLRALAELGTWDLVGVHDGARPLIKCAEIAAVVDALVADPSLDGAVLAIPSTDTVKIVGDDGLIKDTPVRKHLWRAQTPQIFRWNVLMDAYDQPEEALLGATDDASLVEARGGRVAVVQGSPENFKITDRVDLLHAEQILAERRG